MNGPRPILDASAILAFLQGEAGADTVESALERGAMCGAANWSEVAQKVALRADWSIARALLQSYDLTVEPVTAIDAERAAERWATHPTLSLADRLCLALADRFDTTALTSVAEWSDDTRATLIR